MRPEVILTVDDSSTIRKVVQLTLARRGYKTPAAEDGAEGLRLAQELPPDLILVDFALPDMSGPAFCRALAERPALGTVPVVLLVSRTDEISDRSGLGEAVLDVLAKPFSPEALLAAVDRALASRTAAAAAEQSGNGAAPDEHLAEDRTPVEALDQETTGSRTAATDGRPRTSASLLRVAAPLPPPSQPTRPSDEELRDAVARAVAGSDAAGAHVAEEVRSRLTPAAIARLVEELHLERSTPRPALLAGDLSRVPLADVLALCGEQRQDGVLEVTSGAALVQICLRGGRIDFAGAEGLSDTFRIGNYLVRAEAIGRADLELFFGSRGTSVRLCGEQLVKLGHVRAEELRSALRRQTLERIYEALRLPTGRFELRLLSSDDPLFLRAADAALGLAVDALLLEGSRRIDEWHLSRRDLGDDDTVFVRNDEAIAALPPDTLARDEQLVIELCNARNTVRDIVRQSRLPSFEVAQLLVRLRTARLVRPRVPPVAM